MSIPNCLDCNVAMEEGYLAPSAKAFTAWHRGKIAQASDSLLGELVKWGTKNAPPQVQTFRCPQCGRLVSYAPLSEE